VCVVGIYVWYYCEVFWCGLYGGVYYLGVFVWGEYLVFIERVVGGDVVVVVFGELGDVFGVVVEVDGV